MRKAFKFTAEILEAGKTISDKELRLRFYEAILELGINDIQPTETDSFLKSLLLAPTTMINKAHGISDVRSAAGSGGSQAKSIAKLGNTNAKKTRAKTKKRKKSDPIQEVVETMPVKKSSSPKKMALAQKKTTKNQSKRDENIELIDTIKAKVESLGLVYRAGANERISATNIRTAKQFKQTAEKFGLTPTELALAVIEASMSDKFRSGKINNCDTIYYNYARIINQTKANLHRSSQSIISLPGV